MIITDIKQLRDIPVGEVVTLVLEIHTVLTDLDRENPCDGCIFEDSGCNYCCARERRDREEVKFVKI